MAAAPLVGVLEAALPDELADELAELPVADGLLPEAELPAVLEPELPASVACSMVLLPHRLSRACSHSYCSVASVPEAEIQLLYQTRHIWPGTVCWYWLKALVTSVPLRHLQEYLRVD